MNDTFKRLMEIKDNFPELVFNNEGYQYLSTKVKEKYAEQIKEIENLLKAKFKDFVRFHNFKPRTDGTFSIRCEMYYDEITYFIGVVYLDEKDF